MCVESLFAPLAEEVTEIPEAKKPVYATTRGRGKTVKNTGPAAASPFIQDGLNIYLGNSLDHYDQWDIPTVIVSDGGYGVLGFEGDTSDHLGLPEWYEPHIAAWSKAATPAATLWFWNSEIGWAAVHPVLEKYGWRYVELNVWDKGKAMWRATSTQALSVACLS